MPGDRQFLTVDDYEPAAREALAPDVFDYFAGGAGEERTLSENRRAFERWCIRPRMLTGAYPPDPATEVLGTHVSFPVLVAPWAYQTMAHPDGEAATARAARSPSARRPSWSAARRAGASPRRGRTASWTS